MAEALWTQGTGATFSAAEDRRVIAAVLTPGVTSGLVIAAATGRQVTVSAGAAIVSDGAGGCYVAYIDTPATLTIPASSTQTVYIVVDDPGDGTSTVTALSSAPSDPYLALGSATTNASAITGVSNVRSIAVPPSMAAGGPKEPFPVAGGTFTSAIQAPRMVVPGILGAGSPDTTVNMPAGARIGTSQVWGVCYSRAVSVAAQNIANDTWTTVNMETAYVNAGLWGARFNVSTNRFTAPISGVYMLAGQCYWDNPAGANVGARRAGFLRRTAAAPAGDWRLHDSRTAEGHLYSGVSGLMDISAGSTVEFQVAHTQGATLGINRGSYPSGYVTSASFALLYPTS